MSKKFFGLRPLAVFQVGLGVFACATQALHTINHGIGGINIATCVGTEFAWMILLVLALRAHHVHASQTTKENILIYLIWTIGWGVCAGITLWFLSQDPNAWGSGDSFAAALIVIGLVLVVLWKHARALAMDSPQVRALMAIVLRVLPFAISIEKIVLKGGAGWSPMFILQGHISLCIRVWLNRNAYLEHKSDGNRLASLVVETANELVWIGVTIAWLHWKFFM